jgi:Asp-tRNA(Asn)/Glu-tRNA(Gln) amidotransferase A subunit family amidase
VSAAPLRAPWSLRALTGDLASGATTADDAAQRSRCRIDATEDDVRAWVVREPAEPASGAALTGVPLGVKDIIDVAGLPTRCGSPLRADAVPATADAAVVAAWRALGAVPVGKTVTTEFAYFSPGPTRNPSAPGHTPGGSSSGSAAAVAAGHVPLALGSQTAASVTRPAAFCGVAALVLSRGAFPTDGVTGLSPSLDSHGVFTATVSDLAFAYAAFAGVPDPAARPVRRPRLLMWDGGGADVVEPAMREAVDRLRERLVAAGATVDDLPRPGLAATLTLAHPIVMAYEAARERAAELARPDRLSEPLRDLLRRGAALPAAEYDAARDVVASGTEEIGALLATYDAVIGPAAPGAAPPGLGATGNPVLSRPWQALGLPVVTVPGMTDEDGLPLGIQVVGRAGGDADLLATACRIEDVLTGT